jgi:hypothetical protein
VRPACTPVGSSNGDLLATGADKVSTLSMSSELVDESESSESSATAESYEGPPTGADRSLVLGPMCVDAPSPRRLAAPLPTVAPTGLLGTAGREEEEESLGLFLDEAMMDIDVLVAPAGGSVLRGGGEACICADDKGGGRGGGREEPREFWRDWRGGRGGLWPFSSEPDGRVHGVADADSVEGSTEGRKGFDLIVGGGDRFRFIEISTGFRIGGGGKDRVGEASSEVLSTEGSGAFAL